MPATVRYRHGTFGYRMFFAYPCLLRMFPIFMEREWIDASPGVLYTPPMTKTLDDVREKLFAWKEIDIAKESNPVMGNGNPNAEIVFIGEAPGEKENAQGIPFVGQAGKLLDAL